MERGSEGRAPSMARPSWMNECNYNSTQCIHMCTYVCVWVWVFWSNNGVCRVQQNAWINKNSIWIEQQRVEPSQRRATPAEVAATEWYFMRHLLNLKSKPLVPSFPIPPLPQIVSYKSMRINVFRLQRKCCNYFDLSPPHMLASAIAISPGSNPNRNNRKLQGRCYTWNMPAEITYC